MPRYASIWTDSRLMPTPFPTSLSSSVLSFLSRLDFVANMAMDALPHPLLHVLSYSCHVSRVRIGFNRLLTEIDTRVNRPKTQEKRNMLPNPQTLPRKNILQVAR